MADAVVDDALAFASDRPADEWVARVRPPGTDLLAGHPARGAVVDLSGPDRPLVVTSVEEELRARALRIAQVTAVAYGAVRSPDGALVEVGPARRAEHPEAYLQVELEQALTDAEAEAIVPALLLLLGHIDVVTQDHAAMRSRLRRVAACLEDGGADASPDRVDAVATVRWLLDGNALLLGLARTPDPHAARRPDGPDLGLFRSRPPTELTDRDLRRPAPDAEDPLRVSRLARLSPLHRRVPMLLLEAWTPSPDGGGGVVERLLWVVARRAAGAPLSSVPLLRRKLDGLLEREDVVPGSYDEQHLTLLFQSLPEDDLFSLDVETLHALVHELRAEDRDHSVRVALRPAEDSHAVAALVTVPIERWTRPLRERLERFLCAQLDGERVDVALSIGGGSSGVTARFLVHVAPDLPVPDPLDAVAREVRLLCRSWEEQLVSAVPDPPGATPPAPADQAGVLAARWAARLPEAYRDAVRPSDAVRDVLELDAVERGDACADMPAGRRVRVWFARGPGRDAPDRMGLVTDHPIELSRLLPVLESLDLWVTDEARWSAGATLDLHHLGVRVRRAAGGGDEAVSAANRPPSLVGTDTGRRVADAITVLLGGRADRDGLNRLVLHAGLGWDDVGVLRAYRRYRHQVDGRDDQSYVDDVLVAHPGIARLLVTLWHARFGSAPEGGPDRAAGPDAERRARAAAASHEVHRACDALTRLDHDRILRGLAGTIDATLRTNRTVRPEGPLALKIDPSAVPGAPYPRPFREVFVSGRTVEGVHLRAGAVARGGLRASDRVQDYRSEVLDLMRTQVLKNAVIVPTGAKGGFVVRDDPALDGRLGEMVTSDPRARVAAAYDAFVGALLDVTDDIVDGQVRAVPGRWDDDDPYLVVAADKGTATFSDRANALAESRSFWLGDAFASGGSHGYDHKALGITARGAWVAIARHLRALGLDAHRDEVTVAGVGDMSGDVFGNGLLHSDRLRLVAAFDHRHIFLDPDPDPAASYAERRRLFEQPGSAWADYDSELISSGGGVHPRTAKAVALTPEVQAALRTDAAELTPAALVRAVLCAPVDLLYFGGIGTYVRASTEDESRVDDRANAEVRVTGRDLRARVVGEGANLALTQRARIEVARRGGRINMDAIDNAAGVDCSDHEVNLKILLARAEADGLIDRPERDRLLAAHAEDVVSAVLSDCAAQCEALDRAERSTPAGMRTVALVLRRLVADGVLDPEVEALPDEAELEARAQAGAGFTRPELAVLLAGVKRRLAIELLDSTVPDAPVARDALVGYFPAELAERFAGLLDEHRLRRELVAAEVANDLVDHLGLTAVVALADELGVGVPDVTLAYWVVRRVVRAPERWIVLSRRRGATVPDLDPDPVDGGDLLADVLRTLTRAELMRRRGLRGGGPWDPAARIAADRPVADAVLAAAAGDRDADRRRARARLATRLVAGGLDPEVAESAAEVTVLEIVPDVAEVARDLARDPIEVLEAFRAAESGLGLDDLRRRVEALVPDGAWGPAARQGLLDDLVLVRRESARRALAGAEPDDGPAEAVARHLASNPVAAAEAEAVRGRLVREEAVGLDALAVAVRAARRAAL
ncbi:NAD-glutamate dehydrogenase domain-containing protein [Iamia sp.]|uniref:NAD-glutamate dehydrogenase domain-containing protein n=1 Tax=Iamia sp. TaxID=2722710 RepID=UPI002B651BBD|nr:NAD-glutamate dehydrogenase domain-containing protein [Iamia sp.]HXH57905.1 NAD-glutamate dehydrogenase domain-containing protein [Iamia sp.]